MIIRKKETSSSLGSTIYATFVIFKNKGMFSS